MLKDLRDITNTLDDADLLYTLLIDDSPQKNLLNDEFSAIHPITWTPDMLDTFLTSTMLPWLEDMFSSKLCVADFVHSHILAGCQSSGEFKSTLLARNIVIGCSKKWDPTHGTVL